VRVDPVARRELLKQGTIQATGRTVVDVLDGGMMAQLGVSQSSRQPPIMAIADLPLQQEGQPFCMRQPRHIGVRQLPKRRRPCPAGQVGSVDQASDGRRGACRATTSLSKPGRLAGRPTRETWREDGGSRRSKSCGSSDARPFPLNGHCRRVEGRQRRDCPLTRTHLRPPVSKRKLEPTSPAETDAEVQRLGQPWPRCSFCFRHEGLL
jgi:hypothetical protein